MKEKKLEDAPKNKSIAFKTFIESDDLNKEEDVTSITYKFKKFLKRGIFQKKWYRSSNKKEK